MVCFPNQVSHCSGLLQGSHIDFSKELGKTTNSQFTIAAFRASRNEKETAINMAHTQHYESTLEIRSTNF
jgi:hypothetical protein